MARGARVAAVVFVLVCSAALTPAAASAGGCRTKPGPRFDVKMSGKDTYDSRFPGGTFKETEKWSAKWKKVRLDVTRCDGRLHRIQLQSESGTTRTSIDYKESDIVREEEPCNSDFFCPRRAFAAETIKGCRFEHSGTYEARLSLNAYFRDGPSVVIGGGPYDEDLRKDENAAQKAACGDTGRRIRFGVRAFRNDGFEWQVGGYFLSATADSIPDLVRKLGQGRGGTAEAPKQTREERSNDGDVVEKATVQASMTFGDGDRLRNRWPDGFSASTSGALNAILGFDSGRLETLAALHDAMSAPGEINVRGLRPQLRSSDFDRRWAATYVSHVAADDRGDLDALRPRLRDKSASIRALAGFGMAGGGDKAGLPVLIGLLSTDEFMFRSDLEAIAPLVRERLRLLTHARLRKAAAWRRWWREVRTTIRWDRGAKRYRWRRVRPRKRARRPAVSTASTPVAESAADAVKVPIKVQVLWGPGVTQAQKSAILANFQKAMGLLNGGGRTARCKPLEFELDLVVEGDLLPDHIQILVNEIPTANVARYYASWVDPEHEEGRLWTRRAASDLGDEVIAHEFGHIAGLPDEYFEYVDANGNTKTKPLDPSSIMAGPGQLLQRHLDYLSRRHDPDGGAGCERWALRFTSWTSRLDAHTEEAGGSTTNWLGLSAIARIETGFWVDLEGVIRPAGYSPCGEVIPGRTGHNPGGSTTPCPQAGENSAGIDTQVVEGNAYCAPPGASFAFEAPRFHTGVSGSRQGNVFSLELDVGDREKAEASRCEPAVEPGITKRYSLIRDGMRFAGALDFQMSPPTRDFRREEEHRAAFGQASLVRLEPPG